MLNSVCSEESYIIALLKKTSLGAYCVIMMNWAKIFYMCDLPSDNLSNCHCIEHSHESLVMGDWDKLSDSSVLAFSVEGNSL